MKPHFISHESSDTVGVVVVEIVKAGEEVVTMDLFEKYRFTF